MRKREVMRKMSEAGCALMQILGTIPLGVAIRMASDFACDALAKLCSKIFRK